MAGSVGFGKVPFGVLRLQVLIFLCELWLFDREEQNTDGDKHDSRDDQKQRLIVEPVRLCKAHCGEALLRIENRGDAQIDHAADGAHEVDDGVCARAKRLRREVRHKRDGGGAVGSHGDKQKAEDDDKAYRLKGRRGDRIAVVNQRKKVHEKNSAAGSEENVGHALSDFCVRLIRARAEKRQEKECENIVRRHNRAGEGFVHVEGFGENERDDVVIHLPEGADGQKRETGLNCAAAIELHAFAPYQKCCVFEHVHYSGAAVI